MSEETDYFSNEAPMNTIIQEHPEYVSRKNMWRLYRDLYVGGEQIRLSAPQYLSRRLKEPTEVYQERISRVFYENYIGSIIDWYAATLFRREPLIHSEGPHSSRTFLATFAEDCDRKGTTLTDFYRTQFINGLIYGSSYTLVDFPQVPMPATNRAEEDAYGKSRAYLVGYTPEHLSNWGLDERGRFEWVVLRTMLAGESGAGTSGLPRQITWTYYDKRDYRIYRATSPGTEQGELHLVASGQHALAGLDTVPLFEMKAPEGLWLMNKAGHVQMEHFNKANALSWALSMGLYAMPVVYTDKKWSQMMGESYYIQLGTQDRFGWTEPEGKVYQIAAENLKRLQEEIYRTCYLMSQAGGMDSTQAQSGLSKLRDFAITQEVLRAYGDMVKDSIKKVLRAINQAREDGLTIDVSGLDEFDIADFRSDLENAERLMQLGIDSMTFKKYVLKRLAHKYLCDVRQEVKDQISAEIDRGIEESSR